MNSTGLRFNGIGFTMMSKIAKPYSGILFDLKNCTLDISYHGYVHDNNCTWKLENVSGITLLGITVFVIFKEKKWVVWKEIPPWFQKDLLEMCGGQES